MVTAELQTRIDSNTSGADEAVGPGSDTREALGVDTQAADPEPPEPVTAPGGAVSQIQNAVQANLMAAPVRETVDHSTEADAVHAIARQLPCEKQELVGLLRQLLELFDVINGNIRTQKRERSTRFFVSREASNASAPVYDLWYGNVQTLTAMVSNVRRTVHKVHMLDASGQARIKWYDNIQNASGGHKQYHGKLAFTLSVIEKEGLNKQLTVPK
ncbi:TPA: hypothetical protein ACH3X1_014917 [Trebouxia sp. C0004]